MGPSNPDFTDKMNAMRDNIESNVKLLDVIKKDTIQTPTKEGENRGEMMSNLILAYRHLEDAKMRCGKAIQAFDGGVSCYDKTPEESQN